MAYVSNNSDDGSPTVLIVESNAMSIQRLTSLFKLKDFNIVVDEEDKYFPWFIAFDMESVLIPIDKSCGNKTVKIL